MILNYKKMKRRSFLTNSVMLSAAIPLGSTTPALLTSCPSSGKKTTNKNYSAEELGMYSFVDVAPDEYMPNSSAE